MKKLSIVILSVICAAAIGVMTVVLHMTSGRSTHKKTEAGFKPPSFESDAAEGIPEVSESEAYGSVDAKLFEFSICGKPVYTDDRAEIYLTNHSGSGVWLKARLYDRRGKYLGESGLLKEGEYVKSVSISDITENDVQIKIMAYQRNTYYSMGAVVINVTLITSKR